MGRGSRALNGTGDSDGIVPIGVTPPAEPLPEPFPTSRVHRLGVLLMSVCAVTAITTALGFVTVGWAGGSRRIVIAIGIFAVIGFLASAAIAVLGAARDTYARRDGK